MRRAVSVPDKIPPMPIINVNFALSKEARSSMRRSGTRLESNHAFFLVKEQSRTRVSIRASVRERYAVVRVMILRMINIFPSANVAISGICSPYEPTTTVVNAA